MADRDNDDDKDGRNNRKFKIDDNVFESDDDGEFFSDNGFESFINPRQKKKPASLKPKDFSKQQSENIVRPRLSLAPVPEPIVAPKSTAPRLIPCLGCRLTFLRIKRPITLTAPKFPHENESDYCGPCRSAIMAELKEEASNSS